MRAVCHLSIAFEVAQGIDLDAAERLLAHAERQTVKSRRKVPQYFEYRPAPLRSALSQSPPACPPFVALRSEVVLYDFGAASVNYTYEHRGSIATLGTACVALQRLVPTLATAARATLEATLDRIASAATRIELAPEIEDYLIVELDWPPDAPNPRAAVDTLASPLAQVLRASAGPLSADEVADALKVRLSYGPADLALIDWDAAIIIDPEAEETRFVLEFANVQLLELRHLDLELDGAVDRAYQTLAESERGWLRRMRPPIAAFRHQAALQIDSAVLFERVSNAMKLIGDQFLSRVYRAVFERFHLDDWDRGITRKLDVLERMYQKINDQVMARRLEVLEWIVIILIALELVIR